MDRSKSSDSKCFNAALRVLTRSEKSETELRKKLQQFGFSVSAIEATVIKCRGYNYLNDNRYALERARTMLRTGRGVGTKIAYDLRRRGLDDVAVSQALETATSEVSTTDLLRQQFQRRFGSFNYASADNKERRRVVSFFQRRGFPLEQIFTILHETSSDE